jgi:hypothetical protein
MGRDLFQQATAQGADMPVLFGDATDCSQLIYWGILQGVELVERETHYTVAQLRRFTSPHSPQDLVLQSNGERIAPGFIRPYAVCVTPQFLEVDLA